ncbi:hypothetical protein PAECIP111891_07075 [Paenibacillus allorhizoplanae]|uniref:DUF4025 domain-containing protein n=1 Tax=Paenibacillus allorhizoplanae TaxID=2905648 RepID=A0ABM9CZG5_9BACL|nr:hypothetical protein [Paenibacillus allorhizoplanae]CAH1232708.1 hypothetical protein PAECIP111891_07075 [Paenibacillus allorhizoplanae]
MNAFDNINRKQNGVLGEEIEVDSDVNEDRNREQQLDASFQDWYRNIGYWVQQKEDMTQVPKANVFDAAAGMDEEYELNDTTEDEEMDR